MTSVSLASIIKLSGAVYVIVCVNVLYVFAYLCVPTAPPKTTAGRPSPVCSSVLEKVFSVVGLNQLIYQNIISI